MTVVPLLGIDRTELSRARYDMTERKATSTCNFTTLQLRLQIAQCKRIKINNALDRHISSPDMSE
jgi:hypothetical protein